MNSPITIAEAAPLVKSGQLLPKTLVQNCLDRIDRFESQVNAWAHLDAAGALARAEQLQEEIAGGAYRGPLHGIPMGVKDIVDVRGMPTRAGSPLTSAEPVQRDAPLVARLLAAGAIVLGKTVTTEFACFDPPPTRNPWNLERTPGGSSSGSAAGAALGMCLAAIGSQTGGSITRPASYCGVCGCKPTHAAVDVAGVVPVSPRLDHVGPIACCVADLATVLGVLLGENSGWPLEPLAAPPRLGVAEGYFVELASSDVAAATRAAIDKLADAGAQVVTVPLPDDFDQMRAMHLRIMAHDAAAYHRERFTSHPDQFGEQLNSLLQRGQAVSPEQYAAAVAHQRQFTEKMQAATRDVAALLTPATVTTAPGLHTTGDPAFNAPFSYSGLPTVSLPCAVAPDGLPLSLQCAGAAGEEAALLATAAWCEQVLAFDAEPPIARAANPNRADGEL